MSLLGFIRSRASRCVDGRAMLGGKNVGELSEEVEHSEEGRA